MIIRTEKNSHYTTIANYALNDPKLSLKAKGLWAFLMTKPETWSINYRGLKTQLKEGQAAILAALKELEQGGYLVRGSIHAVGDGKFEQAQATLYERPCVENPRTGNPRTGNSRTKVTTDKVRTKQDIDTKVSMGAKAPLTSDYGKEEINLLFDVWVNAMGQPIHHRVERNRKACYSLLKSLGKEEVQRRIWSAAKARGKAYAPQIRDFLELQEKLTKLNDYETSLAKPQTVAYPDVRAMLYPEKVGR